MVVLRLKRAGAGRGPEDPETKTAMNKKKCIAINFHYDGFLRAAAAAVAGEVLGARLALRFVRN